MAASAAQIAQVRRMIAEPTSATYTDAALATYIESYPIMDQNGEESLEVSTVTGLLAANTDWVPCYDLSAAASDLWNEKGAALASRNDFSADGGSFSLSQQYQQAMAQARYYGARRAAKSTRLWPVPRPIVRAPYDED